MHAHTKSAFYGPFFLYSGHRNWTLEPLIWPKHALYSSLILPHPYSKCSLQPSRIPSYWGTEQLISPNPQGGPQWCPILWQWIYPPAKMLTHCLARDLPAGVLLITSPSSLGYSNCALSRLQSIKVGLWALVLSHLYPWPRDLSLK